MGGGSLPTLGVYRDAKSPLHRAMKATPKKEIG